MNKGMNGFGNNLILVKSSEDKDKDRVKKDKKEKSTRGGGTAAILNLMKELLDFQDLVTSCSESQDMEPNKQKIDEFNKQLDQMYGELIDMAKSGRNLGETNEQEVSPEASSPPPPSSSESNMSSSTVNAPSAPMMP